MEACKAESYAMNQLSLYQCKHANVESVQQNLL